MSPALAYSAPPGADQGTSVHERALLVDHTVRKITLRRHDERGDRTVKEAYGSEGSFSHELANKEKWPQIKKVYSILDAAGQEHRRRTLPWSENGGPRILAADGYFEYCAAQRKFEDELDLALPELIAVWDDIIQEKADTDQLFRAQDYPARHELTSRFSIGYNTQPLPRAEDFRVDLGAIETERVKQSIEKNVQAAITTGMTDAFNRTKDVLERMIERLRAYQSNLDDPDAKNKRKGTFHSTLVSNIEDLAGLLPEFASITGNQVMADIAERMRAELTQHSAEQLKDSERKRQETLAAAEDILSAMQAAGFA